MPLILESHDSLPYIDPDLTGPQLSAAASLLASSLDPSHTETAHPSLPPAYEPTFTPAFTAAHAQIASTGTARPPNTGIDLSRYEEPSAPTSASDRDGWRTALTAAYTSQAYLTQRQLNLSLLERYGRNAWLIGNGQVEEELRGLEGELARVRGEVEAVEEERRARQEGVRGEMEGLEGSWRETVGRAIEAEVAGEGLRRRVLEARRAGR